MPTMTAPVSTQAKKSSAVLPAERSAAPCGIGCSAVASSHNISSAAAAAAKATGPMSRSDTPGTAAATIVTLHSVNGAVNISSRWRSSRRRADTHNA